MTAENILPIVNHPEIYLPIHISIRWKPVFSGCLRELIRELVNCCIVSKSGDNLLRA